MLFLSLHPLEVTWAVIYIRRSHCPHSFPGTVTGSIYFFLVTRGELLYLYWLRSFLCPLPRTQAGISTRMIIKFSLYIMPQQW